MESGEGGEEEDAGSGKSSSGAWRSYNLFIDGVSEYSSYSQIRHLFAQHGKVLNLFIQKQKKPGRRFRFGFVRFASKKQAVEAKDKVNGVKINGEAISVSVAKYPAQTF